MNAHRQTLMPRKPDIHCLRYQTSHLSAIQHMLLNIWQVKPAVPPENVLICLFFYFRTSVLQDNASTPSGRDAASPKHCSATPLNPYKFPPKAHHRFLAAGTLERFCQAIATDKPSTLLEILWKPGFLRACPMLWVRPLSAIRPCPGPRPQMHSVPPATGLPNLLAGSPGPANGNNQSVYCAISRRARRVR